MLIPPDPAGSLPPASVYNSPISASPPSGDGKRPIGRKGVHVKYGQKHHSYDKEKAPYPLSYDRHVVELESMDNRLVQYLRGSHSFVTFTESPTRVLDLGCGTGAWVIDAAKAWPECELVGFDLVDIQIPLKCLESSISSRIEWKHGNFLTTKLPFEDDEFDHVHVQSIATGVPENKWGNLFEEICRVLGPGGSVELIEDDAVFPTLPRWFTTALRARPLRTNSISYPNGSHREPHPPSSTTSSPSSGPSAPPSHDHALLESLYNSMFENRFVNTKPSSVLPSYVTTYFRHVTLGPVISFPMPRFAPLQPLPPQIATSHILPDHISDLLGPRPSTASASPPPNVVNRPTSLSFSSTISAATTSTAVSSISTSSPRPRTASAPFSYKIAESSISSFDLTLKDEPNALPILDLATMPLKRFMLDSSLTESESALPPGFLFPMERLASLAERSLAMHLYRSFQVVLASQEAMWEELKDRIRRRKHELLPFGWDDDEELEELQSRKKFEKLIERYRSDMYARVSLWRSLDGLGWPIPVREPLSKAELIEEERLRESMIEARKQATAEEMEVPCRALRVIVGYKL